MNNFANMLSTFVACTNEKQNTVDIIEESIIPQLAMPNVLIDVGCGNGAVSIPLLRHFTERFYAVDCRIDVLSDFLKRLDKNYAGELYLIDTNLDSFKPEFRGDCVIFSYSLGYVGKDLPQEKHDAFRFEKFMSFYDILNPGGVAIVVGSRYEGAYKRLFDYMNVPIHDELDQFNKTIKNQFLVTEYPVPVTVQTDSLDDMINCLRFIVYDDDLHENNDHIEKAARYANSLKQPNDTYLIQYESQLFAIWK